LPELIEAGFQIQAHDPQGMSVMQRLHPEIQIEYCQTPEQVLDNIEALLILTEWSVYRQFSLDLLAKKIGGKVIFDGRNIFDPALMQDFEYYSIGR
jgi:UDPglucose 6-dehydrogenase